MADIASEIKRRRTFAIISHPDAGKTTLTEKFLLYGGAINLAGSVKGKATARHAVSDWMEIEKERGISVTSSVLQFNYDGFCINILDTPGHQDFSEDTYRTLMAADSAVMVIDASKGVEAQTRKLFKVCVMRHIPIFTFINKMDRDANDTFDLLDDIEKELGIATCPINWPLGSGKNFKGVYERGSQKITVGSLRTAASWISWIFLRSSSLRVIGFIATDTTEIPRFSAHFLVSASFIASSRSPACAGISLGRSSSLDSCANAGCSAEINSVFNCPSISSLS